MAIHKRSPQNNWLKKTLKRLPDTYCHVVKLTQSGAKDTFLSSQSQMFKGPPGSTFRTALNETFIKSSNHSAMLPRVSHYQNPVKPPFELSKLPLSKMPPVPSLAGSSTTASYCPGLPPILQRNTQNESKDRSKVTIPNSLSSVSSLTNTKPVEQIKDNNLSTVNSGVNMAASKTYTTVSVSQGQSRTISALTAEKSQHDVEKDSKGQTMITDSSVSLSVVSFSVSSSSSTSNNLSTATITDSSSQKSTTGALRDHHSTNDDSVVDTKDIERRNRRKFYWYGSHKLIKPIKDIPPRFQLMLAETNAEKARCEGRPIILRQHIEQTEHFPSAPGFNPDGQCFLPNLSYDPARLCNPDCLIDRKDLHTIGLATSSAGVSSNTNSVITSSSGSGQNNDPMSDVTSSIAQAASPMYTLHIYSPNGAGTATGTPAGNSCCLHLPGTNGGGPAGGYMPNLQSNPSHHPNSMASPHFQQTPIYFPPQGTQIQPTVPPTASYTAGQQTYSAMFPPTLAPAQTFLANPAPVGAMGSIPPIPQYTPCVTYTQNAQYTVTAVPQ